jgi:hypothetical protein
LGRIATISRPAARLSGTLFGTEIRREVPSPARPRLIKP